MCLLKDCNFMGRGGAVAFTIHVGHPKMGYSKY